MSWNRRLRAAIALAAVLAAGSCGVGGNEWSGEVNAAPVTTAAPLQPTPSVADVTLPPTTPVAADIPRPEAAASVEFERVTAEGMVLRRSLTTFDFGDGAEPAIALIGDHPDGKAGLYLPEAAVSSSTRIVDAISWSGTGGTYVVLLEVGSDVAEVRLKSASGGIDSTAPSADRTASLGVRSVALAGLTVEALTADGSIVGTCAVKGALIVC